VSPDAPVDYLTTEDLVEIAVGVDAARLASVLEIWHVVALFSAAQALAAAGAGRQPVVAKRTATRTHCHRCRRVKSHEATVTQRRQTPAR
jgi:hypothetical protein